MTNNTGVSPNNPARYLGPNVYISEIVNRSREPTSADFRQPETGKLYPLGTLWLVGKNPTTGAYGDLWYLATIIANVASWVQLSLASGGDLNTLTGNIGGVVGPTGGNINIVGDGSTISISGNPGTSTLTASAGPGVATSYQTDSGIALPSSGVLNFTGTNGITTSGSGNTVALTLTTPVTVAHGGTAATSFNINGAVFSNTTTTGALQSSTMTNGQLLIGSTGASPVVASLTAGAGITLTPGAGSLQISAAVSGFVWNVVAGTTQAAVAGNGYIANNAGTVTITLPATSVVGATISVTGINNATGWVIAQNGGNQIFFGNASTTAGAGGSLASSATRDSVTLVCMTANATWNVVSSIGNVTIV